LLPILLLVSHLAQALLSLVRCHLVALALLAARHSDPPFFRRESRRVESSTFGRGDELHWLRVLFENCLCTLAQIRFGIQLDCFLEPPVRLLEIP